MNKLMMVFYALLLPMAVASQTISPKEWMAIQKNEDYLIGMGISTSLEVSRQMALNDLAGRISTKVESQFNYLMSQDVKGKQVSSSSRVDNIIRSYSSVTLNNVAEYTTKDKSGNIVVYRYMKNSELRNMFRRRLGMAKKWAKEAAEREKEGKIGDALQDYYWSLALLRSCPDGDMETIGQENGGTMIQTVFQRVKDILNNVAVQAVGMEKEDSHWRIMLQIDYKGHPAVNFNYKYYNGKDFSSVYTAKDGVGELILPPNAKLNKLKIHAEYECRDEANIHPELYSVMEQTAPVPFQAAILSVNTKGCPQQNCDFVMQIATTGSDQSGASSHSTSQSATSAATSMTDISPAPSSLGPQEVSIYLSTMEQIERGIAQRNYSSLDNCFTTEGLDMFRKLVAYGDAKLLRAPNVQFFRSQERVVCRSFPMSFTFKNNRRTFAEDVVFYLNNDGKVCEVAFGLEEAAVGDIMRREDWSLEARQVMIHFLETYKTAYALKRFDYINSIFSTDALIITGSVVKPTGQTELNPAKMQHVKYTRQTKAEYMANLKKCFAGNEYINIHFADNVVRRSHTKPDVYGIQIKQDYFSSSYGDTGYLFLLIDFTAPSSPLIHVRTWQPDNDPNVRDGRIGIADFIL